MGSVCGCDKEQLGGAGGGGMGSPRSWRRWASQFPQHPRHTLHAPPATPGEDATPVLAQYPPLECKLEDGHPPRDGAPPGRGLGQRRDEPPASLPLAPHCAGDSQDGHVQNRLFHRTGLAPGLEPEHGHRKMSTSQC